LQSRVEEILTLMKQDNIQLDQQTLTQVLGVYTKGLALNRAAERYELLKTQGLKDDMYAFIYRYH
jgi:hypothetical protein